MPVRASRPSLSVASSAPGVRSCKTSSAWCVGVVLASASLAGSAHASLINGSFEQPRVAVGGFVTYSTGSTAINGWTVVGSGVTVVDTAFVDTGINYVAQDGQQWLDLTGPGINLSGNGVTQSVATSIGQLYRLSFFVGSATNNSTIFASTVDLSINGGARVSFTNPTTPTNTLNWREFSTDFVASSSLTSITFFNGSAGSNNLSGLDNVTFQLIPSPASAALLALGGALAVRRRR